MKFQIPWRGAAAFLVFLLPAGAARAQSLTQPEEQDLTARARVFPEVGAGVRAIRRDSAGRTYILAAPNTSILIYSAEGKRAGEIPAPGSKAGAIRLAEDFDVDAAGRIYVADSATRAIKIFGADGRLIHAVPFASPTSIVVLPSGEFAATGLNSPRLVSVFDAGGKLLRDFGDLSDAADPGELNRLLNAGRLAGDSAGNIYYAFTYFPEPTIRKYDRFGYAAWEATVASLDTEPAATAQRRAIFRQEQHEDRRQSAGHLNEVIRAAGVDGGSQEVWVALEEGELLYFDKDGTHRATYSMHTAEGVHLQPSCILVEGDRLLVASDPLGIFEFALPEKSKEKTGTN